MKIRLPLPFVAAALVLTAAQAHANLVITPNFDATILSDPNAAAIENSINNVIGNYESTFTNPINVSIDFSEGGGLGSSVFIPQTISYTDYRNALLATSNEDSVIEQNLPAGPTNPVPSNGNEDVEIKTAQERAIGIDAPANYVIDGTAYDANIQLNTSIMNLSRTGPQDPNDYDIEGVVSHEIDEVLGIGSGLNGLPVGTGDAAGNGVAGFDFYRYSAPGVHSFTTDANAVTYFSVDGGVTPIVYFNQNSGGDFNDWASNGESYDGPPQVQDAFGSPGVDLNFGPSELAALEALGYNVAPSTLVTPEPSSLVAYAIGALLIVGRLLWVRKTRITSTQA